MSTTTILMALGLLAVVFAVNAIRRVQAKRAVRLQSPMQSMPNSGTNVASGIPTSDPSAASVRDAEIQQSSATVTAPDRGLEPETTPPQSTGPSVASPSSPPASTPAPLAASLSISELVQPDNVDSTAEQLTPDEASSSETDSREHHDLLDEIAQLGRSEAEQLDPKLLQYADHADAVVRAAAAFALGESAANHPGRSLNEIVSVLDRLSNDPDLQVRTRSAAALGKIGIASGIVQPDSSEGIQFS